MYALCALEVHERQCISICSHRSTVLDLLDMISIGDQGAVVPLLLVLFASQLSEAPFLGDNNSLLSRELHLRAAQGFENMVQIGILCSDGHQRLANADTCNGTDGLSESATHTGLETISSSTGKHLVDTQDVEGVDTNSEMEVISATVCEEVLVGGNTGGFKSLARNLLTLH